MCQRIVSNRMYSLQDATQRFHLITGGAASTLYGDTPNFDFCNFPSRGSTYKIGSGGWVVYTEPNYQGKYVVHLPGRKQSPNLHPSTDCCLRWVCQQWPGGVWRGWVQALVRTFWLSSADSRSGLQDPHLPRGARVGQGGAEDGAGAPREPRPQQRDLRHLPRPLASHTGDCLLRLSHLHFAAATKCSW